MSSFNPITTSLLQTTQAQRVAATAKDRERRGEPASADRGDRADELDLRVEEVVEPDAASDSTADDGSGAEDGDPRADAESAADSAGGVASLSAADPAPEPDADPPGTRLDLSA